MTNLNGSGHFLIERFFIPIKTLRRVVRKTVTWKVRNVFTATHFAHTSWGEGEVERAQEARSTATCYLANIVEELLETPRV